ncbi:hypothetical protein DRE_01529 [Drechslerella stenobrocha 248]|uniref:Uncharacterized protein n=1 Tax=Drechslerella stenobrocha 248 TaxID=1043628 RepID=W7HU89_9PEZI|nr:hypothetical protein DRE_01529 [Drechslerella stenobrocha 248]
MVGRRQIHQAIHSRMMKRNADDDVVQWDQIVRALVDELKHEVVSFYGNEGSDLEKQYPGFDYLNHKTRLRLSRWLWHRSFFKAIDYLGLSESEINSVVTWWGTLNERRAYEKRTGTVIRDTTGDDIPTWEEVQKINSERLAQENALRDHLLAYGMQQEEVENVLRETDYPSLEESIERTALQAQAIASYRQVRQLEPLFSVARE